MQDSRGWLSDLRYRGDELDYAQSTDGGRSWHTRELTLPVPGRIQSADARVNGKKGRAVVALRITKPDGTGQDAVAVWDVRSARPRFVELMLVGRGDMATDDGVGATTAATVKTRMDFASVALMPDGTVAAAFIDTTAGRVQMAVQAR